MTVMWQEGVRKGPVKVGIHLIMAASIRQVPEGPALPACHMPAGIPTSPMMCTRAVGTARAGLGGTVQNRELRPQSRCPPSWWSRAPWAPADVYRKNWQTGTLAPPN